MLLSLTGENVTWKNVTLEKLFICTPESALCTYNCHDYLYFHCNCLKSIILHCIVELCAVVDIFEEIECHLREL